MTSKDSLHPSSPRFPRLPPRLGPFRSSALPRFLAPCLIATPCVAVSTDDAADLGTMSQTTFDHSIEDLARLEREAESKEHELRQIRAQVAAARQRSMATAPHNPDLLSASQQNNFQFSPLPTSAPQDARLHATPRHGDLTVHTGHQPSVRAVPPTCPIRPVPNMTSRSNINTTRHTP